MKKNTPSVTVGGFVVADDGTILVVRSKKWHDLYVLPGGKVEWGESCHDAFVREIFEETQLKVTNVRYALMLDAIFLQEFHKKCHFVMHDFIADLAPGYRKEDVVLDHENQHYLWVTPAQLRTLPTIKEMIVLLDYYEKHVERQGVIGFDQLTIPCCIGTKPEEKTHAQDIIIDLRVRAPYPKSDDIQHTIDYTALAHICTDRVQQKHYELLETYAHDVLREFFDRFPITWAWIKIRKPASLPNSAGSVIEYERAR